MLSLWGSEKRLDYWSAIRRKSVDPAEIRAVSLLAKVSDERRFSFYCRSGMFPAMGNMSKRIYMVRRFTTVLELDDGVPVNSWCMVVRDRSIAPETDHVVALKNLIEGEEVAFRQTANMTYSNPDTAWCPVDNPYGESGAFVRERDRRMDNRFCLMIGELKHLRKVAAIAMQAKHEVAHQLAREWGKPKKKQAEKPQNVSMNVTSTAYFCNSTATNPIISNSGGLGYFSGRIGVGGLFPA